MTFPVELLPPFTDAGDKVSDRTVGGLIVSVAVSVTPFKAAEIEALDCAGTTIVLTVNVAEDFPDGIVTETGTDAFVELHVSLTTIPVLGAAPLRVTVAVLV